MEVWLNGTFVEREHAMVSAFDAGIQHGIGLFETMSAHNGRVFRAGAHTSRLVESARVLLLSDSLRAEALAKAVNHAVEHNGVDRARVRLTVTGGNLNVLADPAPRRRLDPTVLIDVQPPTVYPDAFFEQGVMVTIAAGRLNPMSPTAGHKTLDYWPRIHALQHAAAGKAGEALWFSVTNHLASGSVSNVFVARDGVLSTPPARGEHEDEDGEAKAVLPGTTRAAVLDVAGEAGVEARIEPLDIHRLLDADEVFLTNSSWGVLPVTAVERKSIGGGEVGGLTTRLREAWLALVEHETAAEGI